MTEKDDNTISAFDLEGDDIQCIEEDGSYIWDFGEYLVDMDDDPDRLRPPLLLAEKVDQHIDENYVQERLFDTLEENDGYEGQSDMIMDCMNKDIMKGFVDEVNRVLKDCCPCYRGTKTITDLKKYFKETMPKD